MKSGKFTARSLVEKYLVRIDEIDKRGPAVNAIIQLNPDALSISEALDQERKAKGARGPLHGIPVLNQRQHRYRGSHDDHGRVSGPCRLKTAQGFFRGAKAGVRRGR